VRVLGTPNTDIFVSKVCLATRKSDPHVPENDKLRDRSRPPRDTVAAAMIRAQDLLRRITNEVFANRAAVTEAGRGGPAAPLCRAAMSCER
jgi:hypothetical protein